MKEERELSATVSYTVKSRDIMKLFTECIFCCETLVHVSLRTERAHGIKLRYINATEHNVIKHLAEFTQGTILMFCYVFFSLMSETRGLFVFQPPSFILLKTCHTTRGGHLVSVQFGKENLSHAF